MCSRAYRPLGFSIYVARAPLLHSRSHPRSFTFYVADPSAPFPMVATGGSARVATGKRRGGRTRLFVRDVDPAKSRTIIATPAVASIRARTRAHEILKPYCLSASIISGL
jgi:hypothetical protein